LAVSQKCIPTLQYYFKVMHPDSYSFVLSTCTNNLLMFIYNVMDTILFCFRFRRWRYLQICFNFVKLLIRYDVPLPANAVKLCIKFLNHDALAIRKVSATLNSPYVMEPRLQNPGNVGLWNLESWTLESGIQLKEKESGFPLMIGIWSPAPKIRNPRCRSQNLRLSWILLHGSISQSTLALSY